MQLPVKLLKEGTDTSQGKHHCHVIKLLNIIFKGIPQIVSNINACQVIGEAIKTTLGPRGLDKMIIDQREKVRCSIISRYHISILVSHFK